MDQHLNDLIEEAVAIVGDGGYEAGTLLALRLHQWQGPGNIPLQEYLAREIPSLTRENAWVALPMILELMRLDTTERAGDTAPWLHLADQVKQIIRPESWGPR
jgi:hypothetical protein